MNAHLLELHQRAIECEAGGFTHLANYWKEEIRKFVNNDVDLMKEASSLPMFNHEHLPENQPK